ncbi:hypothetical protein HNP37_003149 [Flavobacterium nitrogenifigens]|uniref:Uncharacterized protein n=2 Tax=Flavobacterium TaxID=237 RepID=A0A7W7N941_9FLAO|nr:MULTISPECIES: hypothetical protein [Flavobacterium]MBB4803074.1 hypothetical protein [Flavobacterium nitrogenifigens]MBB6388032.1 hypothetical protein [Flavobacterium notoginsengisoli]
MKLITEKQDGAFIHLLENTGSNTLISVFFKLARCFEKFQDQWENESKTIQLIILSYNQKQLIHCQLSKKDLPELKKILSLEHKSGNMKNFKNSYWNTFSFDES